MVFYFYYNNLSLPQSSEDNKPLLLFSRCFVVLVFMSVWSVIINTCVMPSRGSGSCSSYICCSHVATNLLHCFLAPLCSLGSWSCLGHTGDRLCGHALAVVPCSSEALSHPGHAFHLERHISVFRLYAHQQLILFLLGHCSIL